MTRAKSAAATKTAKAKKNSDNREAPDGFLGKNENQFETRPDGETEIPEPDKPASDEDDGLVVVDETSDGDRYLPGMEVKVPKKLFKRALDVKQKRDVMIVAKNDYVGARDLLIKEMQDGEIPEFKLDTGEIVRLTDHINVKISKPKTSMSDIDNDELDID